MGAAQGMLHLHTRSPPLLHRLVAAVVALVTCMKRGGWASGLIQADAVMPLPSPLLPPLLLPSPLLLLLLPSILLL